MKIIFFSILLLMLSTRVFAQSPRECEIFSSPKQFPYYEGGNERMIAFILSNIGDSIQFDCNDNKVHVGFLIDSLGNTHEHRILKGSAGKQYDDALLNACKLLHFYPAIGYDEKPQNYEFSFALLLSCEKNDTKKQVDYNTYEGELVLAVESMPSFNHDRKQHKLIDFINDNIAQIDTLEKNEVVYVQFLVDTLGFTHHHKIQRGVNKQLDAEALRVCRLIKFDNPAKQQGKPVCIYYTVPVKFSPPCSPKKRWQCRRNKH